MKPTAENRNKLFSRYVDAREELEALEIKLEPARKKYDEASRKLWEIDRALIEGERPNDTNPNP